MSRWPTFLLMAVAAAFAVSAGYLASQSLGAGNQNPTETVTINVATGPQGPPGPQGPQGPPGASGSESCPSGFHSGLLVINHPGGQTTILTCIKG